MLTKNILALDQASQTSGWAFFEKGELKDWGKFTFDGDIADRLVAIRAEVIKLINKYNIDFVAFEDIQMQGNVTNNVQTFKVLSEVFGVILETVRELNIDYDIVPSVTWKSTLGIKGRTRPEQKRNAQQYVLDTYKVKAIQDTCDAICIGAHILSNKKSPKVEDFNWD